MGLPNGYTQKPGSIASYFDTILDAQPPERFSIKFLENLGFTSTNDRLLISILKDLGFLSADGVPLQRYFDFMDRTQSRRILADSIRETFSDLFAVNKKAYELNSDDATNKLRTLYAGKKKDNVIEKIAKTFVALCEYADFTSTGIIESKMEEAPLHKTPNVPEKDSPKGISKINSIGSAVALDSLQYHINIVLPDTRDQAVYDAIFRSLREHLGTRHG